LQQLEHLDEFFLGSFKSEREEKKEIKIIIGFTNKLIGLRML